MDLVFARAMSQALAAAPKIPFSADLIRSCLDPQTRPIDALFERAWRDGLGSLAGRSERGRLNGVTGHVGESVAALLLDELGHTVVWQFAGPSSGGHGADLIVLSPDDQLLVVEVKTTLRAGRWPRPSHRDLVQLEAAWLDKDDNPGLATWDLRSDDVHAAVILINCAQCHWRAAVTSDFRTVQAIAEPAA